MVYMSDMKGLLMSSVHVVRLRGQEVAEIKGWDLSDCPGGGKNRVGTFCSIKVFFLSRKASFLSRTNYLKCSKKKKNNNYFLNNLIQFHFYSVLLIIFFSERG